ncbi:MAG: LacI family transcriptional regulator [Christensenellaceae bacterium]|nr:LacI family transcriptional regulator [Christensenellaceae bacterium]
MPTIKDVAKHTGLSYATISKYLNGGNVLPENREKIETAIKELNFTVNEFARGLKTNKSNTVGIIVPDIGNVLAAKTIPITVDILRKNGYATIICDSREDHVRESELVTFLMSKRVDGIINMPVGADGSHLYPALNKKIPVVLLDRLVSDCFGMVDAVLVDNLRAAQEATSYLMSLGHKEIGIIAGPRDVTTAADRLSGYISIFKRNKLDIKDSLIEYSDFFHRERIPLLQAPAGQQPRHDRAVRDQLRHNRGRDDGHQRMRHIRAGRSLGIRLRRYALRKSDQAPHQRYRPADRGDWANHCLLDIGPDDRPQHGSCEDYRPENIRGAAKFR